MNGTATRRREVARTERMLVRLHHPRLQMMLIVALTGAVGFLSSYVFLHSGVESLWLRYLLAVGLAYLAFLFFIWCWLRLRRDDLLDGLDIPTPGSRSGSPSTSGGGGKGGSTDKPFEPGGGKSGGGGASGSYDSQLDSIARSPNSGTSSADAGSGLSDAMDGFDIDLGEAVVVVFAIVVVLGAAWIALSIVWSAPSLMAELMLDAAVSGGLYYRLKRIEGDHWLQTAIRRTALPFAIVAVLFVVAGAAMQAYAPGAKSIGEVMSHNKSPK